MDFTYDTGLVALSVAAAILGSFTGLVLTTGVRQLRGAEAGLRILLGGLGVGGGIWSMHFIAMLAVMVPVRLTYSIPQTLISALIAVAFTTIALWTVAQRRLGSLSLPLSALFLGFGIVGMHYYGMSAIKGCGIRYSLLGVGISVLIAIQASAVALWFAFRKRGVLDTLLGSVALGLAIAAMHYSGMEATRFLLAGDSDFRLEGGLNERLLAVTVGVTLYSVCSICLLVFAVLTFSRRPARARLPGGSDRRLRRLS
jgi:NO-binding membrane sensor protein with MHYT domain